MKGSDRSPSLVIETPAPNTAKLNPARVGIVVAVAIVAAVLVWVFAISGGGSGSSSSPKASAASVAQLEQLAAKLKHPIYWAGTKPGYTYELTQTKSGNVYVRYLPPGVKVGDQRADFLTVGTYPDANPVKRVGAAVKRQNTTHFTAPDGGVAVQYNAHPTSVYLAYPNSSTLLEIFEPSPAQARAVVRSGVIRPLG
jgi:hypothetical protein